ncbi:MAG: hypothetical protein KIT11_04905 [Fimbriimonadaceae bacterium]|nr:hypothetical protein [Fimbriimonadaceae bacterium]QYK56766.1 MAG: hypothetical protein KF733_04615 [Fimbriimonadaceae bacterium]
MLSALVLFAVTPRDEARDLFLSVLDSYAARSSVALKIDHQDSSGLFPGRFEQELKWKKGRRFTLLLVKGEGSDAVSSGLPPDYYCDGERVLVVTSSGEKAEEPIERENVMPGWEVTGDVVLSWLMGTENKKYWASPPAGIETEFTMGEDREWMGEKAKTINFSFVREDQKFESVFYISEDKTRYLGASYELNGKKAWVHYKEQKFDVELPDDLGDGPG